jgi:hypothetical protein
MKKSILMLAAIATLALTSCKDNAAAKVSDANVEVGAGAAADAAKFPVMEFAELEYDFGTIDQGTAVEHMFKFKNTGDAPLVVVDAKSSCGCTVPTWSRESIPPGGEGEMLVKFNGSGQNQVSKTVTVTANTKNGKELIKIKAFVTPKPGAANGSPVQINSSGL